MYEEPSGRDRPLRLLALVGLTAAASTSLLGSTLPAGHGWSASFVALLVGGAAIATTFLFLRPQFSALAGNLDVFVPTGLAMLAEAVIGWLGAALPALMLNGTKVDLVGASLPLSVAVIATFVITILQIVWTTRMLIDLVAGRPFDLRGGLGDALSRSLRGAAALIVGAAGTVAILALMLKILSSVTLVKAVLLGAVLTIAWNAFSIAVVVAVLRGDEPLGRALARGLRASPGVSLLLAGPMLAVLAVLGVLSFAYSSTGDMSNTSTNWQCNSQVTWLPALPERSGWYSTWCKVWDVPVNDFVAFVTSLPLLMMTIAFALRVVEEFEDAGETAPSAGDP